MFGLSSIQGFLIGIAVSMAIGFTTGWQVKGKFVDSAELSHVRATEKVGEGLDDKSKHLADTAADKKDHTQIVYKTITKEIIKYVPATPTPNVATGTPAQTPGGDGQSCGSVVQAQCDWSHTNLSVNAVRVLNYGRINTEPQSTPELDAQGQAPTPIGLRELSASDSEIAKQYYDLAADHDALVDYVTQLVAELKKLRKK